ncbi:Htur_1727 family rSAM-partnered candidate RiPP [Natrialba aegyptia]|uniref:Phenylacetic acid degradation B n=1 Tax=Natrialba aegyptia DSM 13077 TaxID=1227491 RepID=M0AU81_9EURY|nr:Htur_1727 family rSAM-partnered candidate RiPP [Natrialba aegyptia]ELZ02105.1 hypothetical protein C480_17272 [Natrialba aegyptia DSM 13077]
MVAKARRERVERTDRGSPVPQWEVFVRDSETDPLRHVGSVAAHSAAEAHEHATRLFGWYAVDVWLCPADAVERFTTSAFPATDEGDVTEETDAERESGAETEIDTETNGRRIAEGEPRSYEETIGEPR